MDRFDAQIAAIDREVAKAAGAILSETQRALSLLGQVRAGDAAAVEGIEAALFAILQACAFQDLTGQRLTRLADALARRAGVRDPLLNGPADDGLGLDQAAVDRLFNTGSRAR